MKVLAAGGVFLIVSTVLQALAPRSRNILPLGGSPISEMGIVLGILWAVLLINEIISNAD